MSKTIWNPCNFLYPLPVVMVSCGSCPEEYNIVTVAWCGTICSEPAMTYISLRKERHSYDIIKKNGAFVINLITRDQVFATDFCGIKSGRKVDKFLTMGLTPEDAGPVPAPIIRECPLNIVCRTTEIRKLGSHDMFIAEVVNVHADNRFINRKGAFQFNKIESVCYAHGRYYLLGEEVGSFGFSVKQKKNRRNG